MDEVRTSMTIELAMGTVIRRLRKELQLSQDALAANSNLDRSYISLIECGKKNPTLISIFSFAQGLNVSPQRIFREIETLMNINGDRVIAGRSVAADHEELMPS